jgi:hypothetical protein
MALAMVLLSTKLAAYASPSTVMVCTPARFGLVFVLVFFVFVFVSFGLFVFVFVLALVLVSVSGGA